MTIEYLETKAPPRQRWSLLTGVVVVLVIAIAAAILVWSERAKSAANETFVQAVADAQDRARIGEGRVLSTLTYASPMIWSTEVPEDVRTGLRSLVETSAAEAAASLTQVADSVSAATVLPWQSAQQRARDAVLALVLAERARFDEIAADAREIGRALDLERPSAADALAALGASGANEEPVR